MRDIVKERIASGVGYKELDFQPREVREAVGVLTKKS